MSITQTTGDLWAQKGGIRSRATYALGARLRFAIRFGSSQYKQKQKWHPKWDAIFTWRKGRDSVSAAASVRVGSDCHRQSFTTDPFESSRSTQKNKNGIPFGIPSLFGGKGGIRTLGRVLADTRFPVVRLRPAQPPFRTQALTLYHAGNKKSTPFLRLFKIFLFSVKMPFCKSEIS